MVWLLRVNGAGAGPRPAAGGAAAGAPACAGAPGAPPAGDAATDDAAAAAAGAAGPTGCGRATTAVAHVVTQCSDARRDCVATGIAVRRTRARTASRFCMRANDR